MIRHFIYIFFFSYISNIFEKLTKVGFKFLFLFRKYPLTVWQSNTILDDYILFFKLVNIHFCYYPLKILLQILSKLTLGLFSEKVSELVGFDQLFFWEINYSTEWTHYFLVFLSCGDWCGVVRLSFLNNCLMRSFLFLLDLPTMNLFVNWFL